MECLQRCKSVFTKDPTDVAFANSVFSTLLAFDMATRFSGTLSEDSITTWVGHMASSTGLLELHRRGESPHAFLTYATLDSCRVQFSDF